MATALRKSRPRGFDSLEQQVFLNLWRSYDRLRQWEDELFAGHDLTPQQYNVLRLLRGVHPGTLATLTLAQHLVSRAPDITRMLDKLEQRGLIERTRPADDRRTVLVAITAAGLALLEELAEPLRICHARQLGHMKPQDLRRLARLLQQARAPHEDEASAWR
jgi:DNA-binding MarR family transcriptional regulator